MRASNLTEMQRRRAGMLLVIAALAVVWASAGLASGATGSSGGKTLHLTGKVTKLKGVATPSPNITLILLSGQSAVGRIHFPGCSGAGVSVICGGLVRIKNVGKGSVLFTWTCSNVAHASHCVKSVTSPLSHGANTLATITLKTKFAAMVHLHHTFPVTVRKKKGAQ